MNFLKYWLPFIIIFALLFSNGCKKEKILTDCSAKLAFSTDTLTFDTVFTTLASTTLSFKLFNNNNQPVLTNVWLAGGENSNFRLNVDGIPGLAFEDVEVPANDSLYVFVEVTVDPNNQNAPLIIIDSVMFRTNCTTQKVVLAAWGQDAFYYNGEIICDETWMNNSGKPYVVFNSMLVDSFCTLTIEEGVTVNLSPNSRLFVNGTLNINGTLENPVCFQGVRLESFFDDLPGQWQGIHFLKGSINNEINWATIKNSVIGVRVDSLPTNQQPNLRLSNTKIYNTLSSGILGITAVIQAENCLVYNNGEHGVQLELGGLYDFTHCTFANYGSVTINHRTPIVRIANALDAGEVLLLAEMDATFTNCIVHGSLDEELEIAEYPNSGVNFNYNYEYCLLKTFADTTSNYANIIKGSPLFKDRSEDDYALDENSICIDSGTVTLVTTDLAGNMRDVKPDIGAYEYVE